MTPPPAGFAPGPDAAVAGVVACRSLRLPPVLGYLVAGVVIGPNTMALAGQAAPHAGTTSLSRNSRPSRLATWVALRMRCTQKVHFSMTPRGRTVTSGL